jgi:uncharacterized protein (DUF2141 family)
MLDTGADLWWGRSMPTRIAQFPLLILLLSSAPPPGAPIEIAVTHVTHARGRVHVDICPQANFLKEDCPFSGEAPAVAGTTIVTVANVPPGRYAAQAFHDRNSNGRVDRALGIPTEPVGFSNDAPVKMKPPKWDDAVFTHGAERQRITLTLRSFL